MHTVSDTSYHGNQSITIPNLGQITVRSDRAYNEYAFDPISVMVNVYAALGERDYDRFSRQLAVGIARPILTQIHQSLDHHGPGRRAVATTFTLANNELIVSGRIDAPEGPHRFLPESGFTHHWWFAYGVPYRFEQGARHR
jgi:hypothetical protein